MITAEGMAACRVRPLAPFGVELVTDSGDDRAHSPPDARALVALAERHGVVVVRGGAVMSPEELAAFGRAGAAVSPSASGLLEWDFGSVMELAPDPAATNYLFSREPVPFHWDGAFHRVPAFLVFNCVDDGGAEGGGETLFARTETVWETAAPDQRRRWVAAELTYATEKLAHYGGEARVRLVDRHPTRGGVILRFAEPVATALNPVTLTVGGMGPEEGRRLVTELTRRLYDEDVCYAHRWRRGDLVIADNHALVHGRRALTGGSTRRIRRVQIL